MSPAILPTKLRNRATYVRGSAIPIVSPIDPSQHPINAHPSDRKFPQTPNRSQILTPSSPSGGIHPRSLKHASRRCLYRFIDGLVLAVFTPKMLHAPNVSSRSPPGCSGPADESCTTTPTLCPARTARVQPARTISHSHSPRCRSSVVYRAVHRRRSGAA